MHVAPNPAGAARSATAPASSAAIPADAPVVTPRRYGQIASAGALVAFVGWLFYTLANGEIHWSNVPGYFVDHRLLVGVLSTLELTVVAMAVGVGVGVALAIMRQSTNPVLRFTSTTYIWIFRAVPTLVQLLLWYNLALLIPSVHVPLLIDGDMNNIMTPFLAAMLGLGLSEAAYMAEIVRGGIQGVDVGQVEAAKSLGMAPGQTMRRIVLPQATRVILPPTGNETINMLKYTSLAFVIAYSELLSQGKKIYSINFEVLEVLFACSAWYLILVAILSVGQRRLERRVARKSGFGEAR